MSATMQEVIAVARDGDKQQAQLLLAQYIQSNPNDAQGWYLMSQLVDSKARRAAYLNKTLAINPWHERAWAEYYSLPAEVINALEAAQSGQAIPVAASDVPAWLAPAAAAVTVSESASRVQRVTSAQAAIGAESDAAPTLATDATLLPEPAAAPAANAPTVPPPAAAKSTNNSGLTTLLVVLIIATLLVLAFLVYLILQG